MQKIERSKQQEEAESKRPIACGACTELKDCEKCNDLFVPYTVNEFGPRCQAICKLNEQSFQKRGDVSADNIKTQCRRAACFMVRELPGYWYCAEHAAVYRNLLQPKVAPLRIDEDVQSSIFLEVMDVYRRLGRDGLLGDAFLNVAKRNDLVVWWETGGIQELHGKDDFESIERMYKFVRNTLNRRQDPNMSIVTHVDFTFWDTAEVSFIDEQSGYVLWKMDRESPTFPFPVMLAARAVTYEWLYKYIGPIHDDQEPIFRSVDAIFRNRMLAEALLLDPARLFFANVEEYEEPTEEQYHDYKKTSKVPWLRYPLTNRAASLMPSMCSRRLKTDCKGAVLFPVVRYRKLYYNKQELKGDSPFCGTFYFYDPESSIVLNLGRCLVSASKPHAMWMLLNEAYDKTGSKWRTDVVPVLNATNSSIDAYNMLHKDQLLERDDSADDFVKILRLWQKGRDRERAFWDHARPKWPAGSTYDDFATYYFSLLHSKQQGKDLPVAKSVNATPLWPYDKDAMKSTLQWKIGEHDYFDQPLCHLARWLNYDTVLLQHEHGSHRSVTEILDTRLHSYDYLYRTTRDPIHQPWFPAAVHSRYVTVWFKDYGFITV